MSLRWRLARWIAPAPILADPFPGEDGAVVMLRQDGTVASFRADRFRMKASNRLDQYDFGAQPDGGLQAIPTYRRSRHFVRFVGTMGKP